MQNNNSNHLEDANPGTSNRNGEGEEEASMNFSFLMEEASLGSFPAYVASLAVHKKQSEPLQRQDEEDASKQDDDDTENGQGQDGEPTGREQEDPPTDSSTMIRVSLNSRQQASQFSQRSLLLEEGSAHTALTGKGDLNRGDLQDVDLKEDKQPEDDHDSDDDQQSVMSDSQGDEEASTIDIAEVMEQKNRKSIFWAIFTACGVVFVLTLITRWCNKSKNEEQGAEALADEAAQEVAHEVGDQAGIAMRGALMVKQQSVANLANPAYM